MLTDYYVPGIELRHQLILFFPYRLPNYCLITVFESREDFGVVKGQGRRTGKTEARGRVFSPTDFI